MSRSTTLLSLLLFMLLTAVACARTEEEGAAEPTAASEVAETEATAEPQAEPTVAPTAVPTEAAAQPTAEPTAAPTATPAPQRLGLLRFRDNGNARSGDAQLLLPDAGPAPEGTHYELWLVDDSFNTLNLGPVQVEGDTLFVASTDQHLLGNYSSAIVSMEPDDVDDGEIGPVAFNGILPAGSLLHIRHVVFQFPQNPDGKGFLLGADEQARLAVEHAGFLQEELAAGNIDEAQRHAEHVINILEGESGSRFGDLDGDGLAQNPGDSFGARAYLEGARQHAQLAADADDASAEVKLHAEHTIIASDNALARLDGAIDAAVGVISSDTAGEAQPAADELSQLLQAMLDGVDADGDGAVAPIEGEGGIATAYEHALNMGSFEIFAAQEAVPTASETEVEAEADAASTAPNEVIVEMVNFAYAPGDLTIPAGTIVTFVNKDEAQHSATAADGSFDTGLFGQGEQAQVTFDTPGTYTVYCTLHGAADGSGMATTITVEAAEAGAASGEQQAPAEAEEAPAEVVIDMLDFDYSQPEITVAAGTAVTWINQGEQKHSATADDGSFDTGLLDSGQSETLVLDTPGTYAYYCELHGSAGGGGMAAVITVTEGN